MGHGDGAERRQLTVLFCDLVGSTALSSMMDLEDLHDLMLAYQRACAQCIEDAGGFVARFAGDGVLAYFGYPVAVEDAPQRAIHAALSLCTVGEGLAGPPGQPLAVRIGVATGVVVVGDLIGAGEARERAVSGDTPNLAARLQALAAPDTVVVSETTKRLAEGVFDFRSLGLVLHKGLPEPALAWEVLGRRPIVSRYEGRRAVGVSPLISREAELKTLLQAWRATRAGRGQVVGIVGDPGIGKSRLLEEMRRIVGEDSQTQWLEGGGVGIYDNTPFHVVSQFAPQLIFAAPEGGSAAPWSGAEQDWDRGAGETLSRDHLMQRLLQQVWAAAARGPTALVVEDLHWTDPSTLELLDLIVTARDDHPLLVIYTTRVDVGDRWRVDRHQVIRLAVLDEAASASLARSAASGLLSLAQIDTVVSRAAGVPLYIEELTRLLVDQPEGPGDGGLPPTLSELLAARLEDLGPAKRFAQVASVLGREFPAALFSSMVELDGVDPAGALAELQIASVVVCREADAQAVYAFRHALIETAAYGTLVKRQRRALHERAASIIVEHHPDLAEGQPQVLAHHWTQAGDGPRAIAAWEAAGNSANARRAFREAEHAYRQALALLEHVALADRDQGELRIRAAFNRMLHVTQAYSVPEATNSSERVAELCVKVDAPPETPVKEDQLRWRSILTEGDYALAEKIVARVMELTREHGEALWRRTFYLRAGIQQGFYTGDLAQGERDFVAWSEIWDGSHRAPGDDVLSFGIAGLIAELTGRQQEAQCRIDAAFALADQHDDPYDLAMALHSEACFHQFAQDASRLALSAERLAALSKECGFEFARHLASGWLAIVDVNAGRAAHALEKAQQTISGCDRLKANVAMVFWFGVLAQARRLSGDHPGALEAFETALTINDQERIFRPTVLLERAALWVELGRPAEAERDLREVARISAAMGAVLFRVRALVGLAGLHKAAGDRAKLRRTLRSAQALVLAHPGLCAIDQAAVGALAAETGLDRSPVRARVTERRRSTA